MPRQVDAKASPKFKKGKEKRERKFLIRILARLAKTLQHGPTKGEGEGGLEEAACDQHAVQVSVLRGGGAFSPKESEITNEIPGCLQHAGNHEGSVEAKLDHEQEVGSLECRVRTPRLQFFFCRRRI